MPECTHLHGYIVKCGLMNADHHASTRSSAGGTSCSARGGPSAATRAKTQTVSVGPKRAAASRNVHSFTTPRKSTSAAALQHPIDPALQPGGHKPVHKLGDKPGHRVVRQLALPLCLATRRCVGSAHWRVQLLGNVELELPEWRGRLHSRGLHLHLAQRCGRELKTMRRSVKELVGDGGGS